MKQAIEQLKESLQKSQAAILALDELSMKMAQRQELINSVLNGSKN